MTTNQYFIELLSVSLNRLFQSPWGIFGLAMITAAGVLLFLSEAGSGATQDTASTLLQAMPLLADLAGSRVCLVSLAIGGIGCIRRAFSSKTW